MVNQIYSDTSNLISQIGLLFLYFNFFEISINLSNGWKYSEQFQHGLNGMKSRRQTRVVFTRHFWWMISYGYVFNNMQDSLLVFLRQHL